MICGMRIATAVAAAYLMSPSAFADRDKEENRKGRAYEQKYERHGRDDRHGDYRGGDREDEPGRGGHAGVKMPPGHLPPPGECRIWFPDRPPGQQPPPGGLSVARRGGA